jgi:riboflavin kinase/FMN adenylyltransferase
MKIIEGIENITQPFERAVVTIGNFDGVHKGHQVLLRQTIRKARKINGVAIAITFEPHPIKVLKKDGPPLITLYEQKSELIEKIGMDVLICIPFTKTFAAIDARTFVVDLLLDKIGMKAMVVGNDYSFGKNREGSIDMLQEFAREYGFDIIIPEWVQISETWDDRISSTKIRELIMHGHVEEAPTLLGRYYQVRGTVVHGRDRGGKLLGFPTANIHLYDELCPKTGVYAVTVECESGTFNGVANIGYSPTFTDHIFTIEVHLLDFKEDLYDQKIRVNFISRLRDEVKFNNIDELIHQIKKDIMDARLLLLDESINTD